MHKKVTIAIGADHRGFKMKSYIIDNFHNAAHIQWIDVGAFSDERSDYPVFALAACYEILKRNAHYAILLCGTGTGMAITANRFATIYAGVAWNEQIARLNKEDDNVNVLVIPADYIDMTTVLAIVNSWLQSKFKHDRYEERIAMIDAIKI